MMMIQVTPQKKEKLTDCAEKILHFAGKLMQCLEELEESEGEMGQRASYRHMGMRDGDEMNGRFGEDNEYGNRMGMRYRRY